MVIILLVILVAVLIVIIVYILYKCKKSSSGMSHNKIIDIYTMQLMPIKWKIWHEFNWAMIVFEITNFDRNKFKFS